MSNKETEIPEELYQKDFGGEEIQNALADRRRESANKLAAGGIVALIVLPALLIAVAAFGAAYAMCAWGGICL